MIRNLVLALLIGLVGASGASAKEWAQKMFKTTSHDFGNVAQGSKSEFAFEVTNLYQEDVHILDVQTSCGCTTPTISKNTLKTWEKGAIIATLNTRSFSGHRTATIKVIIDKPFYAEVQLTVAGNIHTEVEFQPGSIAFGDVDQGAVREKEVTVTRHGIDNWQITDVRSANDHLEVELGDPIRQRGNVMYKMLVRLKGDAPAGYINDSLTLVTDDPRMPSVPVAVEGRVIPPLSISPSSLFVGVIEPGTTVTKQLVVRAKKPFKIVAVHCADKSFQFKIGAESKTVHLVPVSFLAGEKTGEVEQTIEIETDLALGGKATFVARGTIQSGDASADGVAAKEKAADNK